jgi:hypothetical protein
MSWNLRIMYRFQVNQHSPERDPEQRFYNAPSRANQKMVSSRGVINNPEH